MRFIIDVFLDVLCVLWDIVKLFLGILAIPYEYVLLARDAWYHRGFNKRFNKVVAESRLALKEDRLDDFKAKKIELDELSQELKARPLAKNPFSVY